MVWSLGVLYRLRRLLKSCGLNLFGLAIESSKRSLWLTDELAQLSFYFRLARSKFYKISPVRVNESKLQG